MKPVKIAIVGGGLSGLATATHLKLRGTEMNVPLEVTVWEASQRIGGVIHTERIDVDGVGEFIVDHGADMFSTQPPAAIELCRRLGVEDRLLRPKSEGRGAMIACGNRLIPIPEGFVLMRPTNLLSMLTTPLLSPAGKVRLLKERFVKPRDPAMTDESVGSFVTRRLGPQCLDRIVAPLVAGIYTADVNRLSMAATMAPIWNMESRDGSLARATMRRIRQGEDSTERGSSGARYEQFRAFPEGMIGLIGMLADTVGSSNIQTGCPITSLKGTRSSEGQTTLVSINQGETYDHVVLTTPAKQTAKLLRSLQSSLDDGAVKDKASRRDSDCDTSSQAIDDVIAQLCDIRYASTAIVVMAIPRHRIARMPKTFGFVVSPSERRSILAGSFASEKFPHRAPEGYVIVRVFVGGVLQPDILRHPDERIVAIVARELEDLIGLDSTAEVTEFAAFVNVVRWNDAMPQYEVGHLEKVERIETAMNQIPAIHLMTNAMGGVGIAPIIGSAARLAEKLLP